MRGLEPYFDLVIVLVLAYVIIRGTERIIYWRNFDTGKIDTDTHSIYFSEELESMLNGIDSRFRNWAVEKGVAIHRIAYSDWEFGGEIVLQITVYFEGRRFRRRASLNGISKSIKMTFEDLLGEYALYPDRYSKLQ